jgi:eukaryotic-like serine/threonine-protein kinase
MSALTRRISRSLFLKRRRPRLPKLRTSSDFGDKLTYIVGSSATRIGLSVSVDPAPPPIPTIADVGCRSCDSSLERGRRLGPFLLLSRLGQGAQGEVWKAARQGADGEIVALKILNPSQAKHHRRLAQFRREAERGARLAGPSLLQVLEWGEVEGYLYMAMPFVEGVSLHEVIRSRRAFLRGDDVTLTHPLMNMDDDAYLVGMTQLLAHAARALQVVHANRVVHRDIKPANILLDCNRPQAVYLCDLGLGRDLEVATIDQMRDGAGTPMYMSPERLLRAPADEIRSDVYSMGVTLFEALTLGRPFVDPEGVPLSILSSFLARAHPRTPRSIDPRFPRALEAVVLKAMARCPADRFGSASALADELDRWAGSAKPEVAHRRDDRYHGFVPQPHIAFDTRDPENLPTIHL